eukprot:scaffold35194_cov118-Isochrysis_galbana.AAC.3
MPRLPSAARTQCIRPQRGAMWCGSLADTSLPTHSDSPNPPNPLLSPSPSLTLTPALVAATG